MVEEKEALYEPYIMGSLSFIRADQTTGVTDTDCIGAQTNAASPPRTISQENQGFALAPFLH